MALDLLDRLESLADSQYDLKGLMLEEENLPRRIRRARKAGTDGK